MPQNKNNIIELNFKFNKKQIEIFSVIINSAINDLEYDKIIIKKRLQNVDNEIDNYALTQDINFTNEQIKFLKDLYNEVSIWL